MEFDTALAQRDIVQDSPRGAAPAERASVSTPIGKAPGVATNVRTFFNNVIFKDFYNSFRLTGYLAEVYYSNLQRAIDAKLQANPATAKYAGKEDLHPAFLGPDKNLARRLVNAIEMTAFLGVALIAFVRDRKQLRSEVGDVVAAEIGKPKRNLGLMDMLSSENPLVQTATGRFKSLYIMRFIQPLTFLYGLKLGITATVFGIVAERAAYFENNSYDKLEILSKEIANNQWGKWSRDGVVNQLINVIQKNRAEHNSPPIAAQDLEKYFPLLGKVADRMIEKKWYISDAVHVLGQVIKEPALINRAEIAYQEAEAGLPLMMKKRPHIKVATSQPPVEVATTLVPPETVPEKGFAAKMAETQASSKMPVPAASYAEKALQEKNSRSSAQSVA